MANIRRKWDWKMWKIIIKKTYWLLKDVLNFSSKYLSKLWACLTWLLVYVKLTILDYNFVHVILITYLVSFWDLEQFLEDGKAVWSSKLEEIERQFLSSERSLKKRQKLRNRLKFCHWMWRSQRIFWAAIAMDAVTSLRTELWSLSARILS